MEQPGPLSGLLVADFSRVLASDPRFTRTEDRTARRNELKPLLSERLRLRTAADWFPDLIAAGVPCGPINTVAGGVDFPALRSPPA